MHVQNVARQKEIDNKCAWQIPHVHDRKLDGFLAEVYLFMRWHIVQETSAQRVSFN